MAQINVNRKVHDQFYRYKMPRIIGKVEGRGNGIKTVLANVVDVAKALNVPPDYPTKYLGIELGAQVILDTKNDKFIINGAHVDKKLQTLVYEFIERYLLCSTCQNPETVLSVRKEQIRQSCQACGNTALISVPHKFNTYIIKHPPKNLNSENSRIADNSRSIDKNAEDFSVNSPSSKESENIDWSVDVTDNAIKQRMLELTNKAAELIFHEDLEKSIPERLKILSKKAMPLLTPYLKNEDDLSNDSSALCNFDLILHESKRLDVNDEAIIVISEIIFDSDRIIDRIKQFCYLIAKLVKSEKAESNLLSSIELVVAQHSELAVPKISKVFFCLYQLELVQEDTFMQWSSKKSKRYLGSAKLTEAVHKSAASFIQWLKNAEEESTDSEVIEFAEETKEEVKEFDVSKWRPVQAAGDEEDLNIDDI